MNSPEATTKEEGWSVRDGERRTVVSEARSRTGSDALAALAAFAASSLALAATGGEGGGRGGKQSGGVGRLRRQFKSSSLPSRVKSSPCTVSHHRLVFMFKYAR